jgi:hypothetical protein
LSVEPTRNRVDQRAMKRLRLILHLAVAALVCVALVSYGRPFLWVLPAVAIAVLFECVFRRGAARFVLVNLGVVLLALTGLEAAWSRKMPPRPQLHYGEGYRMKHELLGYGPVPSSKSRSRSTFDGRVVYDVEYTISDAGLRRSTAAPVPADAPALLFFGGSFTFGEGVADEEVLPARVAALGEGRFAVYNFGFHGYGPHQMLAALRGGLVEEVLEHRPEHVVYSLVWDHASRVAGRAGWDPSGPRYVIDNGGVLLAGPFDESQPPPRGWRQMIADGLEKSAIVRRAFPAFGWATEVELLAEVVAESSSFVEHSYPGARFRVLLWDRHARRDSVLEQALRERGLRVHVMSEVLPELLARPAEFRIPVDGHPNAAAYDLVARFLLDRLILDGTEGGIDPAPVD